MPLEWRPRDSASSLAGQLLVASRNLVDPNFFRTVLLILEHGRQSEGALGVILNRPTTHAIADVVPEWLPLTSTPQVVFQGGPVERTAAIALARPVGETPAADETWFTQTIQLPGSLPDRELGIVDLRRSADDLVGRIRDLRIFSGYAGWTAGQLESEIQAGGWLVLDHEDVDPLTSDPATLWNQAASAAASGRGVRASDGPPVHNN